MLWMPCRYDTFGGRLEDCYGLMELKVTWTDLNFFCVCVVVVVLFFVCLLLFLGVFFFGGGREGEGQTLSLYSAYWCL